MAISYTEENKFPLLDNGAGNSGAVLNGVLTNLDKGFEMTVQAGEAIGIYDAVYLKSTTYAITTTTPSHTLEISGNHASKFGTGIKINITDSTNNDGVYTVESATDNGANTDIVVEETIVASATQGNIQRTEMYKAKADSDSTLPAVGIATTAVAQYLEGKVRCLGWIDDDATAWDFTCNDLIYVSATTAGDLTATAPATPQIIGVAKSPTKILICPDLFGISGRIGSLEIGDATNKLVISPSGVVTMEEGAKGILTLRPDFDYTSQIAHNKPTQVTIGIFKGFSLPIYASDNEEIFFRQNVPDRWDGISDILMHIKVALSTGEDVDDKFKLQLSWEHTTVGEAVPTTSNNVEVETTILNGRNAQYSEYEVSFVIDYDIDGSGNEILAHELFSGRLRRIAASASEISGEVIVLDWHMHYNVDKMFKAP